MNYYDGSKLLSLKDLNNNTPEIFICTSNRSAGKSTFFNRYVLRRFINYGEKFMLLYRFKHEITDVSDQFFKDIGSLFFPHSAMTHKLKNNGLYAELYFDNQPCGYAVTINNADFIKKKSHLFSDTARMLFDEFQSETNHYCTNEISKFLSIHTSVARGQNKQVRYVPVIMCSNTVSMLNPYYTALDISARLKKDTKFLRGDGYVLEQGYNDSAAMAQKESTFNKAFGDNRYLEYATQNIYLNDNDTFIGGINDKTTYIASVRYDGSQFAIRHCDKDNVLYCDRNVDQTCRIKIGITAEDITADYSSVALYPALIKVWRNYFNNGLFRFKDLESKTAVMKLLSY